MFQFPLFFCLNLRSVFVLISFSAKYRKRHVLFCVNFCPVFSVLNSVLLNIGKDFFLFFVLISVMF